MEVQIYTDGACSPNPGPGGWGAILRHGDHEREILGGDPGPTTNNRMELTAPIQALECLKRRSQVRIFTDSTYVRNGITSWVKKWQANGWLTQNKEPVKNEDLWKQLHALCSEHQVEWEWVKGHAGHPENERADRLAVRGMVEEGGGSAKQPGERAPRAPRQPSNASTKSATPAKPCGAVTKTGKPCSVPAGDSGLCHVHDPALQCGAINRKGEPCTVATGGGRCKSHYSIPD
ncbi:hypothetical protein GCM10027167_76390 [Nocardia heshunensis]